ncbi:uncharacterized protein LOC119327668 [Triticum dicoccoides]|uniref:uncharacterized protein LOC119327668 n=1 Tax=Triticum dicoccoides TaxID=85692 RepID=UPI001890F94B|nr:uncharacterized protein LOC119327668 [Triticum dicoccoides]
MSDVGSSLGGAAGGGEDGRAISDGSEVQIQDQQPVPPPMPTSRISVKHAVEVIQTFDEYKRWLVQEIGFGGMLKLPMRQKLNLKFSAWTMSKVSVFQRAIILSELKKLKFWPEDVHKVFGIPCGHRSIRGRDGHITPDAIQFIKKTLGMDKKGVHSLRAAEEFLLRDVSETSSKLEKDCFQIAFVIFVMGHVLAPTTKHDYATIDFWGALANTETISQFNLCEYVLQCLLEAVRRLKKDMLSNNPGTNLVGCHLFLQVFFLHSIDLGIFNKKHNVLPRISEFDQDSIRNMITMSTDIGKNPTSHSNNKLRAAEDVCYAWQKYPQDQPNTLLAGTNSGGNSASAACGAHQFSRNDNATVTPTHNVLDVHTPIARLGLLISHTTSAHAIPTWHRMRSLYCSMNRMPGYNIT